jgi:hypothetical protein
VRQGCTDVACLLAFLAFLALMAWLTHWAYVRGDVQKLHRGIDWAGEVCGYGPTVSAKPYLYWCGNGSYTDILQGQGNKSALLMRIPTGLNMEMPICVEACPQGSEEVVCPSVAHVTRTVTGERPEIVMTTVIEREMKGQASYATKARAGAFCLPDLAMADDGDDGGTSEKAALSALQVEIRKWLDKGWASIIVVSFGHLAGDVPNIVPLLCVICGATFLLSFVYLLMLRWLAKLTIYLIISLTALTFFLIAASFIVTAHDLTGHQHLSPLFEYTRSHRVAVIVSDVAGIVFFLLGVSVAILASRMHDTVEMICGCVEEACECIFDMPTLLLEPVVAGALKLAVLCGLLFGLAHLVSAGEVESDELSVGDTAVRGINRHLTLSEEMRIYLRLYAFGIFWIVEVCDACQQFTVSYATVLWYYKPIGADGDKKSPWFPITRGFFNAVFFHLGTLAMGALLIAVVRAMQVVLWPAQKAARRGEGKNPSCECLVTCLTFCLDCFKKSLEFINKMAYVDVAVHSSSFCHATTKVHGFITSDAPVIAMLNSWTWVVQVACVLSISSMGGFGTYALVRNVGRWSDPHSEHSVSEPALLSILAGVFCFVVSSTFMWIFDQCMDTLLYVFAENRHSSPSTLDTFAPPTLTRLVERFEELERSPRSSN